MAGQTPQKRGHADDLLGGAGWSKRLKRGQKPEDEEEEAMKDYKKMQNMLKDVLDQATQKLSQFLSQHNLPETRMRVEHLMNRLAGLKPDILLDPIYIGLFGSTGEGKSTLLNTIIGKTFFLPVSGNRCCTSCVVQVNTSHNRYLEAKIHLLTDEEWKDELKCLVALVEQDEDEDAESREAALKISTIYGEEACAKSYEELCRMKPIVHIPPTRCITLRGTHEQDLSERMRPYISIQSIRNNEEGTSRDDQSTYLWPLIKHVEVTVPALPLIPEGVVFVDIPGMGDFNRKRDAIWKENINKCSVIWVVKSIVRILGEGIHETLLKEGMKAFQSGMCRDISLVVTKSDQINLDEYRWETGRNDINEHDAILERNENVKRSKRETMKKTLEKVLPSDSYVLQKADLVYTVSAQEYNKGKILLKEETEIPKLREYIQTFYTAQKRNKLMDYVSEALVIFSLLQSLRSNQDSQYQDAKEHLEDLSTRAMDALEEKIEACFVPIEQSLSEGVDEAKNSYKKIINKILQRHGGYQGFHRTLKAVCLNKGVYVSRVFHRIDINDCLAWPIYEKIDMSFGDVLRIQMGTCSRLKVCLDTFKNDMQKQLKEAMMTYVVADREDKLKFLQQETEFTFQQTEKFILQKRDEIYQSLTVSIQNDLLQCYEDAAKQRGIGAFKRMKDILSDGIKAKTETGMFERAQEKMRKHLQNLKVEIIQKMKKNFSSMLSVAFYPKDQLNSKLPDFLDELISIRSIHRFLHSAREA